MHRVAVLQILHRQWPRRRIRYPVDITWFNDRVDTLNTFLRNNFKEDRVEGVQFWKHSGFWSPENQELVYTDDGVHLNEVYGYAKYYNNVLLLVNRNEHQTIHWISSTIRLVIIKVTLTCLIRKTMYG